MRPTRWVLTLVVGATVGAAAGFALVWLLVAVAAVAQDRTDVTSPPHVVVVSGLLGAALLAVSGRALVTSSRRATWATAAALVPASLGWRLDPESEPWVPIGLATAVLLVLALLALGVQRGSGPPPPPRRAMRAAVLVVASVVLLVCMLPAADIVHTTLADGMDLMLYHQEEESELYRVLPPFVYGGMAAGVLTEAARQRAHRPVAPEHLPVDV